MTVTSGFYVRSLCHDLGAAVGSMALMSTLVRSRQGEFSLGNNVLEYGDLEKGERGSSDTELGIVTSSVSRIPAELLEVGDVVRVQHGASPPADGTLVSVMGDSASFDESSLTGESRLVRKEIGEKVFVGTINRGAIVDTRVDAIGGETM